LQFFFDVEKKMSDTLREKYYAFVLALQA